MTETEHQILVMCWAKKICLAGRVELDLLFHIPNGGSRSGREGVMFKAMGVKPGVPDLMLPIKRHGYGGLWIEMKTDGGRLSEAQEDWHQRLAWAGHKVVTCWRWQDAIEEIKDYVDRDGEWPEIDMATMAERIAGA